MKTSIKFWNLLLIAKFDLGNLLDALSKCFNFAESYPKEIQIFVVLTFFINPIKCQAVSIKLSEANPVAIPLAP